MPRLFAPELRRRTIKSPPVSNRKLILTRLLRRLKLPTHLRTHPTKEALLPLPHPARGRSVDTVGCGFSPAARTPLSHNASHAAITPQDAIPRLLDLEFDFVRLPRNRPYITNQLAPPALQCFPSLYQSLVGSTLPGHAWTSSNVKCLHSHNLWRLCNNGAT